MFSSIPTHLFEILRYAQDDRGGCWVPPKIHDGSHAPNHPYRITFHDSRFSITYLKCVPYAYVATTAPPALSNSSASPQLFQMELRLLKL